LDIKKLVVSAAVVLFFWNNSMEIAFAQTEEQPEAEPQNQPRTQNFPGTGRPTPEQPAAEARPHPLRFRPSLGVDELYDDNINLTNPREHDFITSVTPGIAVSYQGTSAGLTFGYAADIEFYAEHSDLNTTKHNANLGANYQWLPTLRLEIQDTFVYSPDSTDFNPTGIVTVRANQYNNSVMASATQSLSPLTSASLVYSNEVLRYSTASLVSSTVHAINFVISHNYTAADIVSFIPGVRYFFFSNSTDEKVYSISVGWTHRFSTTFTLDVTGGANMFQDQFREYTPSGLFNLALRKSWKYGSADLQVAQDLTVSGGVSSSSVINRYVVAHLQRNLAEKLTANLAVSYAGNQSISGASVNSTAG
jgi:hypothetical protein